MRKVLIAGVAGLVVMAGCGPDTPDTATRATPDTAQSMSAIPMTVAVPAPMVDSARVRDSLLAKVKRDSARAKAARDSTKRVADRAIANRRRY